MKDFVKIIFNKTNFVYCTIASFFSIISGWSETKDWAKVHWKKLVEFLGVHYESVVNFLYHVSSFFLIFILLYLIIWIIRKIKGTHKIPISFPCLFYYWFYAYKDRKLLESEINDEFNVFISKIEEAKKNSNKGLIDKHSEKFLKCISKKIQKYYGINFSISIKTFCDDDHDSILIPISNYYTEKLPKDFVYRYDDLTYSLNSKDHSGSLSTFVCTAQEENKPDTGHKRRIGNNVFIYLYRNDKNTYWMTNDLLKDEKKGDFFTGSLNYPLFYRSIAIFSIKDTDDTLEGFLIMDSPKAGAFIENEYRKIGNILTPLCEKIIKVYESEE